MENQPLVSIITPCYNGEKFIDRYFKSILNQTYSHIELIFVNDGSIDQTEKIALTYKEKFEKCGCVFHYIFQENQGQAAAINRGLEIFQGEYLIWPDSDDWLEPDSIEKRVAFLEANTEYGFVRSNGYFCKIKDHRVISKRIISENNNRFKKNIFDDLIDETTFCCCGCYMIRKNSFLNVNPERKILENKGGQNWQIEIPIAYNYKCGYIDKPLYNIFERESSHSRKKNTFEEAIEREKNLEKIMIWSIQKADCKDEDYYLRYVKDKFLLKKLYVYFHYSKKKEFNQIYNQLNRDQIKIKELVMKFLICHENIKNKLVFIRDLLKRGLKCLI